MASDPFNFTAEGFVPKAKPKRPKKIASFMAPPVDDPLADVPETGNVEVDSAAELDAMAEAFRARRKREADRHKNVTDSEYWFAVCFHSRADKEHFINAVSSVALMGDKYIDGYALARALGVDMPEADPSEQ